MMSVRLFCVAIAMIIGLIIFSALGERTLGLFGGDRELAARVYKTVFAGVGFSAFALAMPFIFRKFAAASSKTIEKGGASGSIADTVTSSGFVPTLAMAGYWAMGAFLFAAFIIAALIWVNGK